MNWTNVAKPTGTTYTNVDFTGKYAYDESTILYDDPAIFYDGANNLMWTDVPKPVAGLITKPGLATGLLMPPTYVGTQTENIIWTNVPKPT